MSKFKEVKVNIEFSLSVQDGESLTEIVNSLKRRMDSWVIQYASENNASSTPPMISVSTSNVGYADEDE